MAPLRHAVQSRSDTHFMFTAPEEGDQDVVYVQQLEWRRVDWIALAQDRGSWTDWNM
jgi:hypothetical protein